MEKPLARYLNFQAKDLDKACSALSKKYVEHKLCLINKDDELKATHNQASLPGVSLNFLEYGAEVEISAFIDDFYLIQIPLSGSNWIDSGQDQGISNSSVAFISPYQRQVKQHWSADSQQIHVKIDRKLLENELEKLIDETISVPVDFDLLMPLNNPKVSSWCSFIHYLVSEFKKMTPMTYLRMLRLERARKELVTANEGTSVTVIATKYGFTQLGRFASLYEKIYGELPSATLRRSV